MAIILNSPIGDLSGSIGGITFSLHGQKVRACQKRQPKKPNLKNLANAQHFLANYSVSWRNLKSSDKDVWAHMADISGYESGYNFFIHCMLSASAVNVSKFEDCQGMDPNWAVPLRIQDFVTGIVPVDSPVSPLDTTDQPLALDPFFYELSSDFRGAQLTVASVNNSQGFQALRNRDCVFSMLIRYRWTNGARRYVYNVGSIIQSIFADDSPSHDVRIFHTPAQTQFLETNLGHNRLVTAQFILFNFFAGMRQNNIFSTQFYS